MATPAVPNPADSTTGADNRSVAVVIPMPNDPPWELFDQIPANIPIIVSDDSNGNLTPPDRDNVYFYDYAAQEAYAGEHYAAMPPWPMRWWIAPQARGREAAPAS